MLPLINKDPRIYINSGETDHEDTYSGYTVECSCCGPHGETDSVTTEALDPEEGENIRKVPSILVGGTAFITV